MQTLADDGKMPQGLMYDARNAGGESDFDQDGAIDRNREGDVAEQCAFMLQRTLRRHGMFCRRQESVVLDRSPISTCTLAYHSAPPCPHPWYLRGCVCERARKHMSQSV